MAPDEMIPGRHNPRHGSAPNAPLPRLGAKPPTERGWSEPGWNAPWWPDGPHPIGQCLNTGKLLFNQSITEGFSNDRAVDRTFENEVRPK